MPQVSILVSLFWPVLLCLVQLRPSYAKIITYPINEDTTGTLSYSITDSSDVSKHVWSLNNPSSTGVLFVFENFLMYSAEVQISEKVVGGGGAETIIFKCASCQDLVPPYFVSSSPTVTITAFGVVDGNSISASSFTLRFVNILIASHPALLSLSFAFNMGYAHVMPVLLSNGKLPARAVQTWNINTQEASSSNNIKLSLSDLIFSGSSGLTSLKVYDSDNPATQKLLYSGNSAANTIDYWLYSTTGKAYVVLDNSQQTQDSFVSFKLTYLADKDLYRCGSLAGALDTLTANTGFFSDGSRPSFNNLGAIRRSMDCSWLIKPTEGHEDDTITLIFNWVSLKQGSQVLVHDFHNSSGAVLWNSGEQFYQGGLQGRSRTTPPPIVSSGKALFVRFLSESGDDQSYFGFYGEYFLNNALSKGMGSRVQVMSMSSAVDVSLPGPQATYATGFQYKYHIAPEYVSAGSSITFAVNAIDLPNAEDTLTVYDGDAIDSTKVVFVLSGRTRAPLTWFKSKSSEALVVFNSQADVNNGGSIRFNYFTDGPNYHCGFTRNPARLTAPAMSLFDGSSYTGASSSASIFQKQDCQWVIAPEASSGVLLYFTEYAVIGLLSFYDQEIGPNWTASESSRHLIARIVDTMAVPAPIYLPYAEVGIQYWTSASPIGTGFRAYYFRQSNDKSVQSLPGDGIIRLYSSSMTDLVNYAQGNYIPPFLNLTYEIWTKQAQSAYIYFSFAKLNLTGCHAKLRLYDGPSTSSPLLGEYCGENLQSLGHNWIVTSTARATLTFTSDSTINNFGNFKLAYYSNGPNSHCGFNVNPGRLNSKSMVFTDGSALTEKMYNKQSCSWIIEPDISEEGSGESGGFVALEFLYSDLRGGYIEVYKGKSSAADNLLWRCNGCDTIPQLMVSESGSLYIRFATFGALRSSSKMGYGFKAVYWSVNKTSEALLYSNKKAEGKVLEMPPGCKIDATNMNDTYAWHLGLGELSPNDLGMALGVTSRLVFKPRIVSSLSVPAADMSNYARDGRIPSRTGDYQSAFPSAPLSCGTITGNFSNILSTPTYSFRSTQWAQAYMTSDAAGINMHESYGSLNTNQANSADAQYLPAAVCKYLLDSGSQQSINIRGTFGGANSRLRIYGGKFGNDATIFDSLIDVLQPFASSFSINVVAPCGRSLILLETNETSSTPLSHFLTLEYERNVEESPGKACADYYFSLLPVIIPPNPWIPYYIAMGVCAGMCCMFFTYMYMRKMYHKYYPENGCNPFKRIKIYRVVTPRHLAYSPRWDAFRNRFLGKGECLICQDYTKVFKISPCSHKMCPEDLAGYLTSALGDISLFPVKCPLHYEGCTSTIDAKVAKRVLDELSFKKFNEFSDRVKYGEGMRCIFCNNYVNFPEEGKFSMVECPYCIQTFCIRCKKPWHFGSKCPLDGIDDSLVDWQKSSGASKCPACSKLIEKSDVETCNHMIHKITDGIPCIKDRTDFCYCCGEEVEPEYPHDEVKRPGVNHFPEGVYQKCRTVLQRERDSERDRLKRLRRMKNSPGASGGNRRELSFNGLELGENGQVTTDAEGWEKIPDYLLNEAREARGADARLGDDFDKQWDNEMAKSQNAARSELELSDDSDEDVDLGQNVPSARATNAVRGSPAQQRVLNNNTAAVGASTPPATQSPQVARRNNGSPTLVATAATVLPPIVSTGSPPSRQRPSARNSTPTQVPKRQATRVSPGQTY